MRLILNLLATLKSKGILVSLHDSEVNFVLKGNTSSLSIAEKEELKNKKDEILEFLKSAKRSDKYSAIPKLGFQADYILSSSQRRLWILSQFGDPSAYNLAGVYNFKGLLNADSLSSAFNSLLARHDSLRTFFKEDEEGEVRQFIQPAASVNFQLEQSDLRSNPDQQERLKLIIAEEFSRPFDLSQGPLLRAGLYRTGDSHWVFTYTMHHIVSDGWSMNILLHELLQFYVAHLKGETAHLPVLRIQYTDFASWQQSQLLEESQARHKAYWLKQFSGSLPVLELPSDHLRPAVKTYAGKTIGGILDAGLSAGLKNYSSSHGGTLFMGLLSVLNVLFYRYTNQEDMIIGRPIAGREHADLEDQIGFYVNTIALRSRFSGSGSFGDLFEAVKRVTLDAYEHQSYPV